MNLNRLPAWLRERRARPNRENTHGAKGYRSYRGARRPVSWGRRLLLALWRAECGPSAGPAPEQAPFSGKQGSAARPFSPG